jgi:aspartyl-tRNA synthetase
MPYAEAIASTGPTSRTCAPAWRLQDLSAPFAGRASRSSGRDRAGGEVRGFVVPDAARYSRKELDDLSDEAKQLGAAGLVWARTPRAVQSPALKAAGEDVHPRGARPSGAGRRSARRWPPGRRRDGADAGQLR